MTERPLETGWLPDTPVGDTLLRRFVFNQGALNAAMAGAGGGRSERTDDVWLADPGGVVPYLNQAVLLRPLTGDRDAVLDAVESFYAEAKNRPATMLSIWPTPDLRGRGWELVGHPALVVRGPFPHEHTPPSDVEVRKVETAEDLAEAERIAIEGYPMEEVRGLPPGSAFNPGLLGGPVLFRLGLLEGKPVAAASRHVSDGLLNLSFAATLPQARRRGVWASMVWARIADAPDLPAVAYTSDYSRPGFERMGFLPTLRCTMWVRVA